jgi:5-methyltetrahydropteroyltriglutamate--homocysteine methyltransferase
MNATAKMTFDPTTRVDHVGSLLRPEDLKAAFLRRARGQIDDEALAQAQDAAIGEIVRQQEGRGLPVVTDGEYRRLNWQVSFSRVDGWDLWEGAWRNFLAHPDNLGAQEKPGQRGMDAVESFKIPARGKLRLIESFPAREFRFLRDIATRPTKMTLMGPDRVRQMCDIAGSRGAYRDGEAFLADVVSIQRQMIEELIADGCPYIQIDEPSFTGYVDAPSLARMKERGEDPLRFLRAAIEADNAVIAGLQGKATFGLHICRGNRASMWHREGPYDAIAEAVFGGLHFDRLLLEYDSPRAGDFEPLRHVRKGMIVVLGLVTTKHGELEKMDELRRRIDDAARYCPHEQLALSPQCGFASGIGGNALSMDAQWRKLDLILETAQRVWG